MILNKPKLESIFVVVFVLLLFVLLFSTENNRRLENTRHRQDKAKFKKETEELKHKYDSVDFLSRTLAKHYSDIYKLYVSSEEKQIKLEKENDKLRKSRPIPYTDKQLDSLLTKWYGNRPK